MFFGLLNPDSLVRGMDPALDPALGPDPALVPDPSITKQKEKNLDSLMKMYLQCWHFEGH
jgi:hypothetical protein